MTPDYTLNALRRRQLHAELRRLRKETNKPDTWTSIDWRLDELWQLMPERRRQQLRHELLEGIAS